jgi:hypothetical protein
MYEMAPLFKGYRQQAELNLETKGAGSEKKTSSRVVG